MEAIISTFLKSINLGGLKPSDIEPDFDELKKGDTHLGYLNQTLKELYLIFLFCERKVIIFEQEADKDNVSYDYFEEINHWHEKKSLCELLFMHSIRLSYELSYEYGIKIVEDFLVVAYEYKAERIPVFLIKYLSQNKSPQHQR